MQYHFLIVFTTPLLSIYTHLLHNIYTGVMKLFSVYLHFTSQVFFLVNDLTSYNCTFLWVRIIKHSEKTAILDLYNKYIINNNNKYKIKSKKYRHVKLCKNN